VKQKAFLSSASHSVLKGIMRSEKAHAVVKPHLIGWSVAQVSYGALWLVHWPTSVLRRHSWDKLCTNALWIIFFPPHL